MDGAVDDPAWVALPGLPLGCVVERATEPERLFTPEWVSCGEHCSYLARDPAWGWIVDSTGGGVSEGRRYMQVSLSERGRTGAPRIVSLVDVEENRVVAAWRGPSLRAEVTCAISNLGVGEGHVAFALQMFDATREEAWVFHGPIETMKDVEEPVRKIRDEELPGYGNALQRVYASSTTAAFEVQPLGEVWIIEGGELRRRAGVRSAVPGNPQSLALFGRHVLWNEWRTDVRIAQATFDEEASVYFEAEGVRVVFETDGRDLAWVQGAWIEGVGFEGPVELWAARYERDSGLLEPRRVMESYPYSLSGVVGGGEWVIASSARGRQLRDGRPPVREPEKALGTPTGDLAAPSRVGHGRRDRSGGTLARRRRRHLRHVLPPLDRRCGPRRLSLARWSRRRMRRSGGVATNV